MCGVNTTRPAEASQGQADHGKRNSKLAIAYAHQVREELPDTWAFWIHASSSTRFEEGYKTIVERVGLRGWNEPQADISGLVSAWQFGLLGLMFPQS
jgi:hypothetical protein